MKNQVILDVICPHCHHSLMDQEIEIRGFASVRLNIRSEENVKGTVHLCAAYECFEHQKDMPVKEGEIVGFCCPHCHSELLTGDTCQVCGAPMAKMALASGGYVKICSRLGCFNHFLSLSDQESSHKMAH
jgi:hypothetical protein